VFAAGALIIKGGGGSTGGSSDGSSETGSNGHGHGDGNRSLEGIVLHILADVAQSLGLTIVGAVLWYASATCNLLTRHLLLLELALCCALLANCSVL
jgi:hypothetical protein